ncbi:MAG TPA: DUF2207 domain-containing protein [Longimicrobiaceae bacterium]|nr:DUF2207 domain-containing protein [Longimicrobiaceae bacterium]
MPRAPRLALLLAAALALAAPAAAQERSIAIRTFETDLVVRPDGPVDVTETLRFVFTGEWNGVLRDLSLGHRNGQGRRETLRVRDLRVTDEEGQAYRWEEEDTEESALRRLRIWIPGARDAERTVVIRYRVENAVRFVFGDSTAGDFDELYWNATGNGWDMPIEWARARIVLPAGVVPRQTAAYTGPAGTTGPGDADVSTDGSTVTFTTRRPLAPFEGLTVAAGWAPGAIPGRPSAAAHRAQEAGRLWPLALPFFAFFFSFRSWRRRGRDPRQQAIVVGYEPPDGMSPAELGTLLDHEAGIGDVTATLVDLAVRGYVGIEEREEPKLLGLFSTTEYVFHLRKPRSEWGALDEHERLFLDALFRVGATAGVAWDALKAAFAEARRAHEAGEEVDRDAFRDRVVEGTTMETEQVRLSELRNRFYRSLPGIRDAIYERLVARGYYRSRPDKVKANWVGLGIAALVLTAFGTAVGAAALPNWVAGWAMAVGGVLAAALLIGFGIVMPARTEAGARAREAALGFREFLDQVESDRYKRMITSPELFERYLPHAMAFGVEGRWAKAFDDLYREPPDWYSGGGYSGFRASAFASRMNTLSSTAGSTMSSSPSGSSGSGGGGSSGGGSGGGGGSGF